MEHRGIFDSGCSGHMTGNRAHLEDYQELSKEGSVTFGGSKGSISGKGTIRLGNLVFDDVAFVKELGHFNLFSISQICDKKLHVLFTEKECYVVSSDFKLPDASQVLLKVPRQHNMYTFDMKNVDSSKGYTCLLAKASSMKLNYGTGGGSNKQASWYKNRSLVMQETHKAYGVAVRTMNRTPYRANPRFKGGCGVIDIDVRTEDGFWQDLMVVSSTEATRKAAVSEKIATKKTHSPTKSSSTPISKSVDDIMTFRKVKSGNIEAISPSANHEEEVFSDADDDEMPEIRIYDKCKEDQMRTRSPEDESWVEAMQEELLQFKLQQVWVLVDLPNGAKVIGTKWVYRNKKDERGVVCQKTKQGLVAQAEILKKFDLVNVKAAITPMETKLPLTKDEEAFDVDVHLYRSMIGSLMYLTASRPDIMYAVCVCSRFQVTPKTSHLNAVKRIFKYLKGKPNLGLWYPRESPFDLEAFSDSDYGGSNLDRKSTTGGCQFLGQRLISWQCKKQTIVATSTTEAEYVAAANCCGQVLWVQNQLLDYGFNFMNTKIHIDNESTICIVKNPVYHSKTKPIEIRHHFIRDCYEKKLISVEKIHTDLNVADLLTKPFDGPRFNYLVVSIGMINS
ncbi:hypothetical protein Tco_0561976 [Tanacetum coccineum]